MSGALPWLSSLLCLSLTINAYLTHQLRAVRKAAPRSQDARQLLHDLTAGAALVKIVPIDPSEVFLRSPRDL